jgi:predicted porin
MQAVQSASFQANRGSPHVREAQRPVESWTMRLRTYLVLAAMALACAAGLNAQQNPVQATVSSVVSCSSKGNERQQCPADTSAGVVMLRPTGKAACLLGRNWGYDGQGVWVSEGCGGDFATGSTSRSAASVPGATALVESKDEKSQMDTVTTGTNPALLYLGYFEPYGSIRTIVGISNDQAQVQDDATRVGINFTTRGAVKVFATTEWGVNLVQSETQFNVGATTAQGFGTLTQTTSPVFGARLGYVGVDFGRLGRLSFGKQNSTHYDITSYTTDRFNVFGGQASATYVGGTDGGTSGTGRADQTVLYTNKFAKIFEFGAQAQLRGANAPQALDGFGFSLQAKVLPGLKIGGAYNKTYFSDLAEQTIFHGGTDYWTVGAKGTWRFVEYGAVWARERNGDLVFTPDEHGLNTIPVVFSANGLELYSRFKFGRFAAVGGFIDYAPRNLSPLINPNFKTRYAVLGAEWHISPSGYAFLEARLGDTTNAEGQGGYNATAVGFRYDFSWKTPHVE